MDFVSSLRYSARSFTRTPGLTLALLFSIALGIGSNAVVYGFVRGLIASALATAAGAGESDGLPSGAITPEIAESLERVGTLLRIAAGAVFFVACANVGAFLLARASARSRESAVRVALGASRARLASQLLSDSVVISVAGGATGVLLATWTSNILPALFFRRMPNIWCSLQIEWPLPLLQPQVSSSPSRVVCCRSSRCGTIARRPSCSAKVQGPQSSRATSVQAWSWRR